jgi:DNA-directed RNA polymerase subunit K
MDMEYDDDSHEIMVVPKQTFHDHREIMEKYDKMKEKYKTVVKKITRFELPTIIGFRAEEIANGAPVLVDVPKHMTDTLQIAEYEFKKGKTPFIIKKRVGNGFEYWKLEDLVSPM